MKDPPQIIWQRGQITDRQTDRDKRKGRPYWYLLVLGTYEGGNGEYKDKVHTVLTMNSHMKPQKLRPEMSINYAIFKTCPKLAGK